MADATIRTIRCLVEMVVSVAGSSRGYAYCGVGCLNGKAERDFSLVRAGVIVFKW